MSNQLSQAIRSEDETAPARPAPRTARAVKLTRVQQMVEVSLWTNRLDRRLKHRLGEVQAELRKLMSQLGSLLEVPNLEENTRSTIERAVARCRLLREERVAEVTELSVVAADHIYLLDSLATDSRTRALAAEHRLAGVEAQLDFIRTSTTFRLAHYLTAPLRVLRSIVRGELFAGQLECDSELVRSESAPANASEQTSDVYTGRGVVPRELQIDPTDFASYNVYAASDNPGTGFEAYDNWATFYRHHGKAYGASVRPSVTDHLDHLTELHEILSFTGKSVLELGPFEGGNTKQMLDLGARSVVGIEANREFYLKCCLIKNEFKLDGAQFILGNCLEVLEAHLTDTTRPRYDLCIASGILYHFADPLRAIEVVTRCAATVYVWTHFASDTQPKGDRVELQDDAGRWYQGRENVYSTAQHWGGVAEKAVWLTEADIQRAFTDRGFELANVCIGDSHGGKFISFLAQDSS